DNILHRRLGLEIDRACARKDWIAAVDLKRRVALWHGPGSKEDMQRDVISIAVPAALQAVQQTYVSQSGAPGISLRGFETSKAAEFSSTHFPNTPLLPPNAAAQGDTPPLIVHRDAQTLARDRSITDPARVMVFQQQIDLYRISRANIDFKGY